MIRLVCWLHREKTVMSLRPKRNRSHFADGIFKCIFLNENVWIALKISLEYIPKIRINNIPALVQIMAWRRPGDKPLSEPMMVSLLTHICVNRPHWVQQINYGLQLSERHRWVICRKSAKMTHLFVSSMIITIILDKQFWYDVYILKH